MVASLAAEVGVPGAAERIQDPAVKERLFVASRAAIDLGVFGVPTMIVDGEIFWGNDSFPHLARFLAGHDPVPQGDEARWEAVKPSAKR